MLGHFTNELIEEASYMHKQVGDGEIARTYDYIKQMFVDDARWYLNEDAFAFIRNTDLVTGDVAAIRLPFPSMTIEYRSEMDLKYLTDGTRYNAPRRIIHLSEVIAPNAERLIVLNAFWDQHDGPMGTTWAVGMLSINFREDIFKHVDEWFYPSPEKGVGGDISFGSSTQSNAPFPTPAFPISFRFLEATQQQAGSMYELLKDYTEEVNVALAFLSIINCNNVPVREIPPPEKLNKKRAKRGKSQIPMYRTLHISDHRSIKHDHVPGTHASPRTHWRRGHIRNQHTALGPVKKWIKPCIVNSGESSVPSKPKVAVT